MSKPREPDPVKLITSLFSPEKAVLEKTIEELSELFGPIDWISPELFFDRTRYYEREMGWPLYRRFASFERLIRPETLTSVKLQTNAVEKQYEENGKRKVNIDPGCISPERLILATGKNYVHRVYLSRGIYADLTLVFQRGHFQPLAWTYKDYADPEIRGWFEKVRENYMMQRRGGKTLDL